MLFSRIFTSLRIFIDDDTIHNFDEEKEYKKSKGPTGVAAAAIYIAALMSQERRTQRSVADVAGVTEVTIRNRYKEITEKLSLNIEEIE